MFDFKNIYEVATIQSAIHALVQYPNAWLIAGGTDTVLGMREGLFSGRDLISINGVEELKGIFMDEAKNIHIRSGTVFREIADNPMIQANIPYFADAVETIGSPQIRTMATLGGNISNGFATADAPPTLFALNALVKLCGPVGDRIIPIQDYYKGSEQMDLRQGELLVDIILPFDDYNGYTGIYIKYAIREAMDIAILGCTVLCKLSEDQKTVKDIRISLCAAAPVPIRIYGAEEKIKGETVAVDLFDKIGQYVKMEINPITDNRATREFRLHLAGVLAERAFKKALSKLGIVRE